MLLCVQQSFPVFQTTLVTRAFNIAKAAHVGSIAPLVRPKAPGTPCVWHRSLLFCKKVVNLATAVHLLPCLKILVVSKHLLCSP